jgi:putative ABC transport system ATP-binding protein
MTEPGRAESLVRVERVTKQYLLGKTTVHALRGVDLTVQSGEFLAIAGPSGSGKTTLLNLIGCIEQPTSGTVWVRGRDVAGLSRTALAQLRGELLGFIFQNFNLLPVLTALENVEYPLGVKTGSGGRRRERAMAALEQVGLGRFVDHKPMELSGGQRQRVAIARAMATEPLIVLADEPTANLDHATGQDILALMRRLNQQHGTTFIFSTHDQQVMDLATRIVRLWDGTVAASA